MSVSPPRRVTGTVTRHEAYGFYINFGEDREGLVVITMVVNDGAVANPPFPAVGTTVNAALLGYAEIGGEPRLSMRPIDVYGTDV